ncbi:MAG: metal-dependent hydrolase [Saprospiraceae bacterium]|jgi:L-ascorbate metabolism protein UlaG (beta-lactamase superfamily)|nr:metal-dependent hydrolase [Saprospiraceae bacterium]
MDLTYYGHGCLGLKSQGYNLLIDPFITDNPLNTTISADDILADFILLTHAHGDHIGDVERIAQRTNAKIISNFEIVTYYETRGLTGHPMNLGGMALFPFGSLKSVIALHSSVFPDGTYGGNPGGFVMWNDEGCCYFAGDTALTMDMKLIPAMCPPLDFAVLPIGDNFTMGIADAVLAAQFIQCDTIIGCHYDTFGYIKLDHQKAVDAFSTSGKNLFLPKIGETISL